VREPLPQTTLILQKPIVLVGMMGSGKSAVGTALARRLGVTFRDSDTEIVSAAQRSIAEIFSRDGEAFFRAREAEVIARLLEEAPGILSTGGGAFLQETTRALIAHHGGVSVWLKADLDLLWNRVRYKDTRPLLRTADPRRTLRDLLVARTPAYAMADLVVEAQPAYSIEDMVDRVIAELRGAGHLQETHP
jgi:shikimate kinase